MAHAKFQAEVLTPGRAGLQRRGRDGLDAHDRRARSRVLANHQPLLGLLEPTELRLYRSENEVERFAQGEGYLQVTGDSALVLVEEAIPPGDLDTADLRERLSRAESAAGSAEEGSEEERQALRDAKRWRAFLEIAEGG